MIKVKIYKLLLNLSYRLRCEATYLEMKLLVKSMLKKGGHWTKIIHPYDRGIGKSCALARLSVKYNIPISVPYQSWKQLYEYDIPRYIPKYFKKKKPEAIVMTENIRRGSKKFEYLLIEEGFEPIDLDKIVIPMCMNSVAYKNSY